MPVPGKMKHAALIQVRSLRKSFRARRGMEHGASGKMERDPCWVKGFKTQCKK